MSTIRKCVAASRWILATALVATLGLAHAQIADDAREDRLAQQVAPQVVVGDVMWLATPQRAKILALYTEAPSAKGGVIVVHGLGVHPDWGLNGALRTALADRGFTTLSVQMPVLAATASREQYRALYGIAGDRITAAIGVLRAHGIAKIAIVSHSLGAGMVDAFLAQPDPASIAAWVPIGMLVDFARAPRAPVLDIVAADDFPEVQAAVKLREARLPRDRCSRVVIVPGTDHYFERATDALVAAIAPFLERAFAGECEQ